MSEPLAGTGRQAGARRAGLDKRHGAVLTLAVLIAVFYPSLAEHVVPRWWEIEGFFSHGFLVLAMMAMLIWQDRRRAFGSREPGSWLWVAAAAAAAAVWFVAWAADLLAVQMAAMVGLMLAAVCAVLGRSSLVPFGLPFALLFFAVPMWSPVQPPLQIAAAGIAERLVAWSGVPVHIEGTFVTIPAGVFEVERGCSGIGFLLVSLCLAGYLCLSSRCRFGRTLVVGLSAVALALLANWLRIYLIIMIADYGGMDQKIVHSHDWVGWGVYAVLVVPLLPLVARWLDRADGPRNGAPEPAAAGRVGTAFVAMAIAAAAVLPLAARALDYAMAYDRPQLAALPEVDGYRLAAGDRRTWMPAFPTADQLERRDYRPRPGKGGAVMAFRAGYRRQQDGVEVVNIVNEPGGAGWRARDLGTVTIADSGRTVTWERFADSADKSLCVWYWYRVGDAHAGTDVDAKVEQVLQKMQGRGDASLTAVATVLEEPGNCGSGQPRLADVAARIIEATVGTTGELPHD